MALSSIEAHICALRLTFAIYFLHFALCILPFVFCPLYFALYLLPIRSSLFPDLTSTQEPCVVAETALLYIDSHNCAGNQK